VSCQSGFCAGVPAGRGPMSRRETGAAAGARGAAGRCARSTRAVVEYRANTARSSGRGARSRVPRGRVPGARALNRRRLTSGRFREREGIFPRLVTHLDVACSLDVLARDGGPAEKRGGRRQPFVPGIARAGRCCTRSRGARSGRTLRKENRSRRGALHWERVVPEIASPSSRAHALELGADASELVGGERGSHDDCPSC